MRAQVPVPEPGLEPVLVQLAWPVRRASSVLPERAPEPVCWPLAVRRVPDARRVCRKRNTRQSPG
ncbi:msl4295 [Mesorhizobium japonicum MAFF 303099]|uniref:Msl4295 protein n=1 Tax=Mesorhizobium japonicum (strain LMG 29417 / CECT 9101 / MAFF 303099) TaxID=266835 RepID=Q98ED6_RHILO|nr:msl4295 [Mesorhizobium japonicum MAFF 303099]